MKYEGTFQVTKSSEKHGLKKGDLLTVTGQTSNHVTFGSLTLKKGTVDSLMKPVSVSVRGIDA